MFVKNADTGADSVIQTFEINEERGQKKEKTNGKWREKNSVELTIACCMVQKEKEWVYAEHTRYH